MEQGTCYLQGAVLNRGTSWTKPVEQGTCYLQGAVLNRAPPETASKRRRPGQLWGWLYRTWVVGVVPSRWAGQASLIRGGQVGTCRVVLPSERHAHDGHAGLVQVARGHVGLLQVARVHGLGCEDEKGAAAWCPAEARASRTGRPPVLFAGGEQRDYAREGRGHLWCPAEARPRARAGGTGCPPVPFARLYHSPACTIRWG